MSQLIKFIDFIWFDWEHTNWWLNLRQAHDNVKRTRYWWCLTDIDVSNTNVAIHINIEIELNRLRRIFNHMKWHFILSTGINIRKCPHTHTHKLHSNAYINSLHIYVNNAAIGRICQLGAKWSFKKYIEINIRDFHLFQCCTALITLHRFPFLALFQVLLSECIHSCHWP